MALNERELVWLENLRRIEDNPLAPPVSSGFTNRLLARMYMRLDELEDKVKDLERELRWIASDYTDKDRVELRFQPSGIEG